MIIEMKRDERAAAKLAVAFEHVRAAPNKRAQSADKPERQHDTAEKINECILPRANRIDTYQV
jgi:hypothetical protein